VIILNSQFGLQWEEDSGRRRIHRQPHASSRARVGMGRPFGLAVVVLLAVLARARLKSRPRAVVRGPAQESLLVLVSDHADHAAGLHRTIIQGVLAPPPLPGSTHHSRRREPRPDDVIVVCSDSGASCSAQGCSCRGRPGWLQLSRCPAVLIALLCAALLLYITAVYCHARVLAHTDQHKEDLSRLGFATRRSVVLSLPPPRRRQSKHAAHATASDCCAGHEKLLGVGKQTSPIRSAHQDC